MKRRTLLQLLLSAIGTGLARIGLDAHTIARLKPHATGEGVFRAWQTAAFSAADIDRIRVLANVVLPQEIGTDGRAEAVNRFATWLREYRPAVDTDHGYGFPRLHRTGPSPAAKYPVQLDALDAAARKRGHDFKETALADQQAIVEAAIGGAKIDRLPSRPDGGHIATDLMAFFFHSVEAQDLCYRARIGRDTCRELVGSDERPSALTSREG